MPEHSEREPAQDAGTDQDVMPEAIAAAVANQRLQLDYALARREERLMRLRMSDDHETLSS
jgi:hypothetical protein